MNLLCAVGLHHPLWQDDRNHNTWTGRTWLYIRTCARCGQPLDRATPR